MSTHTRGGDELGRDVDDRLSAINGYYGGREGERIGSRAMRQPDAEADDLGDSPYDGLERPGGRTDEAGVGGVALRHDLSSAEDTLDQDDPDDRDLDDGTPPAGQRHPRDGDGPWKGRLRAVDVHHVTFPRAPFTRRGYDERSVDDFLSRVELELVRLVEERADLRDEVARLKRQLRAVSGTQVPHLEEAQAQAVRLLAKAQQLADSTIAEAEDHSRRVSEEARDQYDETVTAARAEADRILLDAREAADELLRQAQEDASALLRRAQESADESAAQAVALAPNDSTGVVRSDSNGGRDANAERQELEDQVAYLRAFGQVTRTQLRAYLEALLQDVEDEWGRAAPAAAAPAGRERVEQAPQPRPASPARERRRSGSKSAPEQVAPAAEDPAATEPVQAGRGS